MRATSLLAIAVCVGGVYSAATWAATPAAGASPYVCSEGDPSGKGAPNGTCIHLDNIEQLPDGKRRARLFQKLPNHQIRGSDFVLTVPCPYENGAKGAASLSIGDIDGGAGPGKDRVAATIAALDQYQVPNAVCAAANVRAPKVAATYICQQTTPLRPNDSMYCFRTDDIEVRADQSRSAGLYIQDFSRTRPADVTITTACPASDTEDGAQLQSRDKLNSERVRGTLRSLASTKMFSQLCAAVAVPGDRPDPAAQMGDSFKPPTRPLYFKDQRCVNATDSNGKPFGLCYDQTMVRRSGDSFLAVLFMNYKVRGEQQKWTQFVLKSNCATGSAMMYDRMAKTLRESSNPRTIELAKLMCK